MSIIRVCRPLRLWIGWLCFLFGLCGEGVSGVLFLQGAGLGLCLWHVWAVLVWAFGINLLCEAGVPRGGLTAHWRTFMNKWVIAALLLGLFTFPGSGTLTYSIALVALLRRKVGAVSPQLEPVPEKVSVSAAASQPAAEVLQGTDIETKRLAVATLSRQATPEAIQVLRQLLLDPQAEIRTDASIALTHLEERFSRALNSSLEQWTKNTSDQQCTLDLADQYYQYACSNVLDEASQHFYLVKAYDLVQRVTAQGVTEADLWLKLARICQRLDKLEEALQAVRTSFQFGPPTSDAYLLAMELAFRLRDWDGLVAFASEGAGALPEASEISASLQWWSTLRARRYGEAVHA